ncbi:hypothetical protein BpHYR1_020745 [Brachionus plicatilis]|uniref:Uncharacterized protein n=1 Tax=Brachionus plicatilis TaxID=10195 RepID=A0A3M7QE59_BRAPC|nr:hypothetical protein BpHYR1_020745 [Brachionus plicatilis]
MSAHLVKGYFGLSLYFFQRLDVVGPFWKILDVMARNSMEKLVIKDENLDFISYRYSLIYDINEQIETKLKTLINKASIKLYLNKNIFLFIIIFTLTEISSKEAFKAHLKFKWGGRQNKDMTKYRLGLYIQLDTRKHLTVPKLRIKNSDQFKPKTDKHETNLRILRLVTDYKSENIEAFLEGKFNIIQ